jgi:hypothetical protein
LGTKVGWAGREERRHRDAGRTGLAQEQAADIAGLRAFVERLNVVDRAVRKECFFDVILNFSEEVVTACAFDIFPNWIMLSWRIEGGGRGRSPSAALLAKIAKRYRAAANRRAPSSSRS